MGWTEAEALAADVNSIAVAWEGLRESDHEMKAAIYGAQGIKLPPLTPIKPSPQTVAAEVRQWARDHNARRRQGRTVEEARAAAVAKASQRRETE